MPRLSEEILNRCEDASHRIVDVAETLEKHGRSRRIVEQIIGCGTSVGANVFEADEAMSRKDFAKCLATSLKELSECRFWLRFAARRDWIAAERLKPLLDEVMELRRILGSMVVRTQQSSPSPRPPM